MDFDALRAHQHGSFSVWQLRRAGWSRAKVRHAIRGLREEHHGVYITGDAPLTDWQRAWAAVLTEPGTRLSHTSRARLGGFDDWRTDKETVTRAGSGGPIELDGLTVHRSAYLPPGVLWEFDGLPCLSPARTILDLIPNRSDRNARRLVRNALRVRALTGRDLHVAIALHAGRPGIPRLRQYARDYGHLPIHRTRSDAEALGLAILDGAGIPIPLVNVKIHGEEADYAWLAARWIIELDGGQWHHPLDDAIKQAVWERAGWTVKRLPTDAIFNQPHRLLTIAPPLGVRSVRL